MLVILLRYIRLHFDDWLAAALMHLYRVGHQRPMAKQKPVGIVAISI
jgi:hypothetical protein